TDGDADSRGLILGSGQRAEETARLIRTQASGEYQVAGMLDPKLDLAAPVNDDDDEVLAAVAGVEPPPPPPLVTVAAEPQPGEVAPAPAPAVLPGAPLRRARAAQGSALAAPADRSGGRRRAHFAPLAGRQAHLRPAHEHAPARLRRTAPGRARGADQARLAGTRLLRAGAHRPGRQ